jgi:glycosyltransferase involved in cell wall biosynthesis/ribosomal protein S18 acetylase RimI-like enzyme
MSPRVAHVSTVDLTPRFLVLPQLRALRDAGIDISVVCAPGPWTTDLINEGFAHVPWRHATRSWDPGEDARAFVELVRIFRRERFDLVHTHNPKPGILGRIAARVAGIPLVMNTVHGLYAVPEDRAPKRIAVLTAEWVAARCSDLELYQSAEDLVWARRLGIVRADRSMRLGNGIDLERFHPTSLGERERRALREELGFGDDDVVVGSVGRMVREKGYLELFEAARRVRRTEPRVRFLVVGEPDGQKEDALPPAAIESARPDVVVTGWREDVPELLSIMDVFVLPSWREGLPRSAIEAAASGVPSVLTDIRGCREVVRDGVEGLLVAPHDVEGLSAAIARLATDPDLRERMGKAARARAEGRFDERRVTDMIVRSTWRLLGRAAPDGGIPEGRVGFRRAVSHDVSSLAHLHRSTMPTAFLPTLGEPFLRQLYGCLVHDREAVVMVAIDEDERVVGFAAAVPSVGAFYRRFTARRGLPAAAVAAPALLHRSVARRAGETLRHPSSTSTLPDAELLSIAVGSRWRARGVGRQLAERVGRGLALGGSETLKVVVGADNEPANRFYESLGYRHECRIDVHRGETSNVWVASCRS